MRSLQVKKQLLAFFMPGFLIGILYANCFLKQTIVDTNLFDIEILKKYTEINSFGNIYFLYIVQIRLIPFALLMALAFTKIKKLLMPIVVSGSAFSIGILLTVAVIKMGMKGEICLYHHPYHQHAKDKNCFLSTPLSARILHTVYQ